MEWFSNWWDSLALIEQVLYCVAIPSTLILLIKAILIIVGFGDVDTDFDYSSGPSDFGSASLFSIQGVASFFSVFGWVSLLLRRMGIPTSLSVIVGLLFGGLVMYAMARLMFALLKLAHTGTLDVQNLRGSGGSVYLKIPPKGEGRGKVTIQTSERLVEFDAISEDEGVIPNNAEVRVVDILGGNVLVVERI
ncbi:MAG: hypothetical protein FWF76_02385 [Oscillospiraceae bacterium]|nr:hypothetical protein [Oscillospiraceae bacterium]